MQYYAASQQNANTAEKQVLPEWQHIKADGVNHILWAVGGYQINVVCQIPHHLP